MGVGTLSNSTVGATRRWFTLRQTAVAAGTRTITATQAQTLMATIEGVFLQNIPSVAAAVVAATRASLIWFPSLTSALTIQSGTVVLKEATKTVNKVTRVHQLYIGRPDPLRTGS